MSGAADTKAGYMQGFREKYSFRDVKRDDLNIRLFGDVAVMTGPLTQRLIVRETGEVMEVRAFTTQVWHRSGEGWVMNTCHNAPLKV
ncbi:nuclear transport factor 2 family protein [Paracoccus luteus]|uniref:nuclear transport factor 2 family protein n=1 Tax=Paracoccus luteus TaxID=2508543 RepID=UPI0024829AAB|nr:nuclear transport factor 2 family protein [Paracoccus luteus]